jgi:DNA-binding NarL/FixJ family response regulator
VSLLASDRLLDPLVAEGVELGEAGSAPSAIVVDYSVGEPEEILSITEAFPGTPLVMIGADPATDGPGLSGAPVAYLPSDVDAAALAAAVRATATGLIVLDPSVAGATGVHAHARTSENVETLTTREREVLLLVAEGLPNKAIARELGISEHTAKFHVGSLLAKLGAASRTEAVTLATRRGILPV